MLIKEAWEEFKTRVIHPEANENQIKCMELAFYSGAITIMMINESLSQPNISEDVGCKILEALMQECMEYMEFHK